MERNIVIVDPLSTGQELAPAFAERGVRAIAVMSMLDTPAAVLSGWFPENFEHILVWNGTERGRHVLAEHLRQFDPLAVIPGSEFGVLLAEHLAAEVTPDLANDPALILARRDKWDMGQAVAAAGIPTLKQFRAESVEQAAAWIEQEGLGGSKLVLKPTNSCATDSVHFVEAGGDLRTPFEAILGHTNITNQVNTTVLLQEFAEGVEYIVDLYAVDGEYGLVDVCRYTKAVRYDKADHGRTGIYERVDFLPPDSPEVPELFAFAQQVAKAVGIRNFSAHVEVMLTAAGPRLVEIGARPAGGGHQMVTRLATGDAQIQRTVRHLVDGEFKPGYDWLRHVRAAFLTAPRSGTWRNGDLFDQVDGLPTFDCKHIPYGTGDVVPASTGLFDAFGWVVFADPDLDAVEADFAKLKELEAQIILD
ncbi:ATP-grasp domain-containing protein [Catenulispora pinisilvae]|uniref:ATP-grasp domain-containing protein n=1 Tax=Catenulispora pinisilvae TaxID=2705253 RepID=UPI00189164E9|nr:ATP-grasp domain-containing protein [Catenulispora pinisilvae]